MNENIYLSKPANTADLLSQVTIIILSKDRASDLKLVLNFWEQYPCSVIVLHDTNSPLQRAQTSNNVVYIACQGSVFKRLELINNLIATPYCMLANDDEIFLPNGLRNIIKFLNNNQEIDCAGGQVCAYTWVGKKILGQHIYKYLLNHSTLDSDCYFRIKSNFQIPNYMDLLAVYKTSKFLKITSHCSKFDCFTTPYMFEVMFTFFSSIYCKSIRMSILYWVRNWYNNMHTNKNDWNRNVKWSKWYTEQKYSLERENWRSKLILEIEQSFFNESSSKEFTNFNFIFMLFDLLAVDVEGYSVKFSRSNVILKYLIRYLLPSDYLRWRVQASLPWRNSHVMKPFDEILLEMVEQGIEVNLEDIQIFNEFSRKQI